MRWLNNKGREIISRPLLLMNLRLGDLAAVSFADGLSDAGCEGGQAEEGSGGDGCGDDVVGVEGNCRDVAGGEAGEVVGVHAAACQDYEVAEEEEGGGGGEDGTTDPQHGGLAAEELVTDEADGGVPSPGDEVAAGLEGIAVGVDGEVVVGRHEGEDRDERLPAAATGAEEEEASADGGEVHAGGVEGDGKNAAENSE
jgi:hypothetical protein